MPFCLKNRRSLTLTSKRSKPWISYPLIIDHPAAMGFLVSCAWRGSSPAKSPAQLGQAGNPLEPMQVASSRIASCTQCWGLKCCWMLPRLPLFLQHDDLEMPVYCERGNVNICWSEGPWKPIACSCRVYAFQMVYIYSISTHCIYTMHRCSVLYIVHVFGC